MVAPLALSIATAVINVMRGATIVRSRSDDQRQFAVPDDPGRVPYLSLDLRVKPPWTMSPSVLSIAEDQRRRRAAPLELRRAKGV